MTSLKRAKGCVQVQESILLGQVDAKLCKASTDNSTIVFQPGDHGNQAKKGFIKYWEESNVNILVRLQSENMCETRSAWSPESIPSLILVSHKWQVEQAEEWA